MSSYANRIHFPMVVAWLICFSFTLCRAEKADTTVVRQFAELLGAGAYARMAWSKGDSNVWGNLEVPEGLYYDKIYVCDTKDGQRRVLTQGLPSGHLMNASFTADGSRLTFSNGISREVFVCDFRGTNLRKIFTGGISFHTWRDPIALSDWVIVNDASGVYRVNIDTPIVRIPLMTKPFYYRNIYTSRDSVGTFTTKVAYASLSPNGSLLCAGFPFYSNLGIMAVPDGPIRRFALNGCWASYSPVDNNKIMYTITPHTNIRIVDTTDHELVNKNIASGISGAPALPNKYYNSLRWSNDDDIVSHWNGGKVFGASTLAPVIQRISTTRWVSLYDNATDFNANTDVFVYTGSISDTSDARIDTSTVDNTGVNRPIQVSAGSDTSFTLSPTEIFTLHCIVDDDQKRLREPQIQWSMLSGPSPDTIASPKTQYTSILFKSWGTYTFRVQAFDGEYTAADTVAVTVGQGRPLTLIAPKGGEMIAIGTTDTVKWDIHPPQGMSIYLSTNDGLTWEELTTQAVGILPPYQFTWTVDSSLSPSNTCLIKVSSYALHDQLSAASGRFSLVRASQNARSLRADVHRKGIRLQGSTRIFFADVESPVGTLTFIDARGQIAVRAHAGGGWADVRNAALASGFYLVELRTDAGKHYRSRCAWLK